MNSPGMSGIETLRALTDLVAAGLERHGGAGAADDFRSWRQP